jgi:hypothetical protein
LTAKDERWRTKLGFWMFCFRCCGWGGGQTVMDGTWKCVFLTHPSFHGIRICSVYQCWVGSRWFGGLEPQVPVAFSTDRTRTGYSPGW